MAPSFEKKKKTKKPKDLPELHGIVTVYTVSRSVHR
jgi:hypothetical protein